MTTNQANLKNQHCPSSTDTDVIVIGGGIVGLWTAYYLLEAGCRVTIVERDEIGAGASSGNCGYICPSHVMPLCGPGAISASLPSLLRRHGALSIPARFDPTLWRWLIKFALHCRTQQQQHAAAARHELLHNSMTLYRQFVAQTGVQCQWQERGLLVVHRHQKSYDNYQKTAEHLQSEFDIKAQSMAGQALMDFEPTLIDGLAGGWYFPADAHLHPGDLLIGLKQSILNRGGQIFEDTEVLELEISKGQVKGLRTSRGTLRAESYVLATGAEAPRFAKPLRCNIPIVPGKGYSMRVPSLPHMPRTPMIFEDSHVAITPLGNDLRIGSTMQLTGYDRSHDSRRVQMIRNHAQSYLRERLPEQTTDVWSGWRPMVFDDLPCIDRCPAAANAYVAAGNGMIGLSTGTATGKLIADMITGRQPDIDQTPFSLSRFNAQANSKFRSSRRSENC